MTEVLEKVSARTSTSIRPYDELVRSTQACMLWDRDFTEDGESIGARIKKLVHQCKPDAVAALAVSARNQMKLRTVPLVLARELARHKDLPQYPKLVSTLLVDVIQRADEMSAFMDLYWADGKTPISKQVKVGLANAFSKFNEYSLGKYKKEGKDITTRDVLLMVHGKPSDAGGLSKFTKLERKLLKEASNAEAEKQLKALRPDGFTKGEVLYANVVKGDLSIPNTWENELSAGKDKKETFTRLMKEKKLGADAFLKNLRNMKQSGVDVKLVADYANNVNVERILPFRFVAAARHVPSWEGIIEPMMYRCIKDMPKLKGRTVFIVDISGSMGTALSAKSELNRLDTALALAMLAREQCEDAAIYATAGNDGKRIHATALVPNVRGFALADAIKGMNATLGGGGIFLNQVMDFVAKKEQDADRVLVLTDEQDCDTKCNPESANAFAKRNYLINIASEKKGISHDKFCHITSMSENVLSYIQLCES